MIDNYALSDGRHTCLLPCGCTHEYTIAKDGTIDERTTHTYRCTSTRVLRLDRAGVRAAQRAIARAKASP